MSKEQIVEAWAVIEKANSLVVSVHPNRRVAYTHRDQEFLGRTGEAMVIPCTITYTLTPTRSKKIIKTRSGHNL